MPQAIQPDLAHQQRAVAGDGVQVGQVGVKPVRRFQIDVEADQVEKRELQVLGGGIVDVGEKPVGIFSPHRVRQPLEVPLDPAWSQPAYDRGGDLIAQGVAQQRSEEHTSELQSRQYLVCRLLLEKKKNNGY